MQDARFGLWLVALLGVACGPAVEGNPGPGSSGTTHDTTGDGTVSAGSTTTSPGTTGAVDPSTEGITTDPPESSTGEPGCNYLGCEPDVPVAVECSLWEDECPQGEKCTPWANDGGIAWNATRCVPVAADPAGPGEPCHVEDATLSGLDDCEFGSMCWDADPETLEGWCISFCISEHTPSCEDPANVCKVNEDVLALCFPGCNPLDTDPCPDGQGCYTNEGESFLCTADASDDGGGLFEPCAAPNDCDPGRVCVLSDTIAACTDAAEGCCSTWCDLYAPDCPTDTACTPYFSEDVPGLENVGVCVQAER